MNASAVTGSAMADVKWAPPGAPVPALAAGLCLPKLPPLPEIGEGAPTPCQISQNNLRRNFAPEQKLSLLILPRLRGRWIAV